MDDLSSINWAPSNPSAPTTGSGQTQTQNSRANYYPALTPTPPLSGRSTPSYGAPAGIGQKPLFNAFSGSQDTGSNNDSFANLVTFDISQSSKGLSLKEQQRILQEKKAKAEHERGRHLDSHFAASSILNVTTKPPGPSKPTSTFSAPTATNTQTRSDRKMRDSAQEPYLGIPNGTPHSAPKTPVDDETDMLAAFSSSASVDSSSHMPIIIDNGAPEPRPENTPNTLETSRAKGDTFDDNNADDPFGLGVAANPKPVVSRTQRPEDSSDDVLGLLSRPVSEFSVPRQKKEVVSPPTPMVSPGPLDHAIAELMDMGFSLEKAKLALESTGSRPDVQAAVGWLLSQAHDESRKEHRGSRRDSIGGSSSRRRVIQKKSSESGSLRPAWMLEQGRSGQRSQHPENKSPLRGERDTAQYAQDIGNNLFKTANSLWKTGTKKINQAVAELNSDTDTSQPKWMRESNGEPHPPRTRTTQSHNDVNGRVGKGWNDSMQKVSSPPKIDVTDEALMLESSNTRPQRRQDARAGVVHSTARHEGAIDQIQLSARRREPSPSRSKFLQQNSRNDQKLKLSREAVESEADQAYISPARRRKPVTKQTPSPEETQSDLLSAQSSSPSQAGQSQSIPQSYLLTNSRLRLKEPHLERIPPVPKRAIPSISPSNMQQSSAARQEGTAAFKRGDYAEAINHYSRTVSLIPPQHPSILPALTNRALSYLKIGDPKASIADAKRVLELIGPSRGVNEVIDVGGEEGIKQMDVYWSKAMIRQAEALEQLEKWGDAATTWRACVEASVGGATSIAGRNRCEQALKPKSTVQAKKTPSRPAAKPSAFDDFMFHSGQSAEAVTRLRAANAAADKLDDEKFKLADQVDARVSKWRAGKESNLRALLSSLETVLWEDAGWKKVGMGDVLAPNKVKIIYMKGIAKVHPDKVSLFSIHNISLLPHSTKLR